MKLHITLYSNEIKDVLIAHIANQLNMPKSQISVTGYIPSDTSITINTESKPTNNEDEDKELTND